MTFLLEGENFITGERFFRRAERLHYFQTSEADVDSIIQQLNANPYALLTYKETKQKGLYILEENKKCIWWLRCYKGQWEKRECSYTGIYNSDGMALVVK